MPRNFTLHKEHGGASSLQENNGVTHRLHHWIRPSTEPTLILSMPVPLQIALLAASANNAVVNKYTPAGGMTPFFA